MRCAYHYGWTLVLDVLFFPANRNVVLMQDLESRLTKTLFLAFSRERSKFKEIEGLASGTSYQVFATRYLEELARNL